MENLISFRKPYHKSNNNNNNNKNKKNNNLKEILNEYSLKRNNFNPSRSSPNKFVNKLELRMKLYYNDIMISSK
tara:strand:- start:272 stop:493 length:222 start_codon:yes stop_codon:yes gene_type:complete